MARCRIVYLTSSSNYHWIMTKKLTFRQQNVMGKELIYKIVYYKNILLWKQNLKNWKKFFRN